MEEANLKLIPRCITGDRCVAYVNTGHLSPCCWIDGYDIQTSEDYRQFFTEEMKVKNNDSIQKILDTKVWVDFYQMLRDRPLEAPKVCWQYCGKFNHTVSQRTPERDILREDKIKNLRESQ